MKDENFRKVKFDTGFIERYPELLKPTSEEIDLPLIAAGLSIETMDAENKSTSSKQPDSKWKTHARQLGVSRNYLL